MNKFLNQFKNGFILGIAIIIPGFSGSTIAYILGFYEELLESIGHFFKHIKKSLNLLIPLFLGIFVSCISLFIPLIYLMNHYPFSVLCFFTGLFIGSLPSFIKPINFHQKHSFIYVLLGFLFSFIFSNLKNVIKISLFFDTFSWFMLIIWIFVGLIIAIGLLTPGLSLTFLLMSLNFYYPLLNLGSSLLKGDISFIVIVSLSVIFISFVIFLMSYSRLLNLLLKRHKNTPHLFILGIIFATIIQTFLSEDFAINKSYPITFLQICYTFFWGLSLFFFGFYLIVTLEKRKERGRKMRLDRYCATSGIGTRRSVKKYIRHGHVKVNDEVINDPSFNVDENNDLVYFDDELLHYQQYHYVLLYKPKGYVSSTIEERGHPPVTDLVADLGYRDLSLVGRLDMDTTGLLLLTNDGKLAHRLLAPKYHVDKTYLVETDYPIPHDLPQKFLKGVQVLDYVTEPAKLELLGDTKALITIHEGKYHQIKRMFLTAGCKVISLHRLSFAFLTLDGLKEGEYRLLSEDEIERLRSL